MASKALAPDELFGHVQDAPYFLVPRGWFGADAKGHLLIPQPLATPKLDAAGHVVTHHDIPTYEPIWELQTRNDFVNSLVKPFDLVLTKFMVLEVVAAVIIVLIFGLLAMRLRGGKAPTGLLTNLLESMLVFIRDKVARPAIGAHDADRFMPFLWTQFFFILGCNLLGMLPWLGSPTGAMAMTGVMALITFATVLAAGISQYGLTGYLKAQVPHMDLPKALAIVLVPLIFVLEIAGLFIKHFVLAVRLLANILAGHVVLAVIVAFIAVTTESILWYGVAPASVLGAMALSLLELFVAFLQAYIFTFLSALFIGASLHAH